MQDEETLSSNDLFDSIDSFMRLATITALEKPSEKEDCAPLLRLLEGTFRRNVQRARSVIQLTECDDDLPGPALEITRNLIEDVTSIEYILLEPAKTDGLVERFSDFLWIQQYEDVLFYRTVHTPEYLEQHRDKIEETEAKVEELVEKYKDSKYKFRDGNGQLAKSWMRKSVNDMINKLLESYTDEDEISRLELMRRFYLLGNRSAHFNPADINDQLILNDQGEARGQELQSMRCAVLSSLCLLWLFKRYREEYSKRDDSVLTTPTLQEKVDDLEDSFAYYLQNIDRIKLDHKSAHY